MGKDQGFVHELMGKECCVTNQLQSDLDADFLAHKCVKLYQTVAEKAVTMGSVLHAYLGLHV